MGENSKIISLKILGVGLVASVLSPADLPQSWAGSLSQVDFGLP